jgi:hypothetical protein
VLRDDDDDDDDEGRRLTDGEGALARRGAF